MKIDKAIEILSGDNFGCVWPTPESEVEAVNLGIEALIRERNNRINPGAYRDLPLLGETKD